MPLTNSAYRLRVYRPEREFLDLIAGDVARNLEGLHHRLFVDVDPPAGEILHDRPLRLLEPGASRERNILKLGKVGVKAVEDDPRKAALFVHGVPLSNCQGSVGGRMLRRNLRIPPIQRS